MSYLVVLLLVAMVGLLWGIERRLKTLSEQLNWIVVPIRERGVADAMNFVDSRRAVREFEQFVAEKLHDPPTA